MAKLITYFYFVIIIFGSLIHSEKLVAELKRLVFAEGCLNPSLDRSKRFTIRKYRQGAHDFSKDEVVVGEFKEGLDILLHVTEDTLKRPFKLLQRSKRMCEKKGGHWFDDTYFEDLKSYYPDLTWDTMGAVIFFEVLKVDGVPVVQFNEHAQSA